MAGGVRRRRPSTGMVLTPSEPKTRTTYHSDQRQHLAYESSTRTGVTWGRRSLDGTTVGITLGVLSYLCWLAGPSRLSALLLQGSFLTTTGLHHGMPDSKGTQSTDCFPIVLGNMPDIFHTVSV